MSERLPPAEIVGVGIVTSVGLYAAAAKAAIRAGLTRARKTTVINKAVERQAMRLVDDEYLEPLDPALSSQGMTSSHLRMLQLGGPALAEATAVSHDPAPLLLALPEVRPGVEDPIAPSFLQQLAVQARVRIATSESALYRQGGAGALYALRDGLSLLASGKTSQVIIGGIDTFLALARLASLDAEDRLYGARSLLGFQPGEGAAFLLLRSAQERQQRGPASPQVFARVMGVGVGNEKAHRYSQEPYRGDGLAEAFADLFDPLPPDYPKVRCVYCGFNGENMPAKEWGASRLRHTKRFVDDPEI